MYHRTKNRSRSTPGRHLAAAALCVVIGSVAHAQSSVSLYGIIDTGIDFASNVAQVSNGSVAPGSGQRLYQTRSGVPLGSRWGLTGSEDLGGDLKTVFRLESGFDAQTGALGASSTLFSRNAYAGLSSSRYGTLTFGRQWDAIVDIVEPFTLNGNLGGWYFAHPNDIDNTDNGFSIANDIKYASPSIGGLSFEGHYSLGAQAGEFSNNASYGGGARYASGHLLAGLAYLRVNDPEVAVVGYQSGGGYLNAIYGAALAQARSQDIFAAGASYRFGRLQVLGDYTNTRLQAGDNAHDVTFQNYELAAIYAPTGAFTLAGGYTFTSGRDHATGSAPRYQQLNLIAQYALSKRTDVYLMTAFQRAFGDARYAQIAGFNPSSTSRQVVSRIGLTHHF